METKTPEAKSFQKTFNLFKSQKNNANTSSDPILRNTRPEIFDFNQSRMRNLFHSNNSKTDRLGKSSSGMSLTPRAKEEKSYDFEDLKDMVPKWMLDRADFKEFYIRSAMAENVDLGKVVSSPVDLRDHFEKDVLFKWISSLDYFLKTPKNVLKELCERLSCRKIKINEKSKKNIVINEGSKADSMYIIYKGTVGIFVNGLRVAFNKEGDVFGDIALDTNSTRTADVIAESDEVILFSISDMDYRNILFNYKNSEKQKYCRFLSFINFFSSWTFNKLQQFSSSLVKVCFKAGCTIYDFQEESQVFYIIKSGKVELQTMIEIQQTNRWPVNTHEWKTRKVITNYIFPIKLLERHQFFGQFEFIKKSKRETRAVSMEDTVCLSINKNDFEAFFKDGDLKVLQKMNENYMPSHQEMEKITRLNIQSAKMSQEILLDAMKIRVLPVDKDCLAGINSKKLKNWITCLQKRNMHEEHKIGERIVRRVLKKDLGEDKDTVSQLPKIGNAEMVSARSRSGIIPIGSVRKSECDEFLQYSRNNRAFSVLQKKGVNPLAISKQFSPVFGISHKSRV